MASPMAKPMIAGMSQPRFWSNSGRKPLAKSTAASRCSAERTEAGSVFIKSKIAAAHVKIMTEI